MKKTTLQSIAERCGCSITTVSRVINGKAAKYRISHKTSEAVMAEVTRSSYIPTFTTRSLRKKRSGMIGLLLPSIANPYFAEMASVIVSELYKSGYTAILVDTMEDATRLNENARALLLRRVEGIIAVPCGDNPETLEMIGREVPVVLIDRYFETTGLSYVTTNNLKGGYDITRLLIESGHKNIACIQGARDSMPNRERVNGYVQAMTEAGLKDYIRVSGNEFSVQNGYLGTKVLMNDTNRPTAIFGLSNTILLGALKAIHESGLDVPEDVSLVSFDDNLYMDYLTPSITRVSQPVDNMAKLSVRILLEYLDQPGAPTNSQIRLLPDIIQGRSVKNFRIE
ncbi:MAG: LacI family DNA-binding transcriptional regulator [Bacteroidales bacterium]|nr:LacI family DNA-binding transcriptional regulator [Bacteroidales bacterium]